jgi:hypothetical protein
MRIYYRIILLNLIWVFISCQPNPKLREAEQLMETEYDSAYAVLQRVDPTSLHIPSDKALYALLYCQALDKNEIYTGSDSLISIATDYYEKRDDEKAAYSWFYKSRIAGRNSESIVQANALLKAQSHALSTKNNNLLALIYSDKALMYSSQLKYDSAILYYHKTSDSFKIVEDKYNSNLSKIYEGYMWLMINQPDSAEKVCKEININSYNDNILLSFYYRTLGGIYISKNDYELSIKIFKKTPKTLNSSYDDNTKYLIAKSYCFIGKYDSAYLYLKDLKTLGEMAPDYYKMLKQIYINKKDYHNATFFAEKAYIAIDSIYSKRINESFAGMEKKFNYQKLQIINRELQLKYFRALVLILIFLLILSMGTATIFFWRNRIKKKQLEIEKQLVVNQTLRAEKEEENSKLLEQQLALQKIIFTNLEQYRNNALKSPEKIKEGFSPVKNEHFYIEVFTAIDVEYNNFSKRLSEKFPQLNETDIFICCLLLAGFETGMIASILNIKLESMNIRRSRLRKRMQLDNQVNLLDYLRQF